ncbi:MAG: outer membrane beta-barrel protein [Gammaproteobacteria bacterium]|nr:outer membrane beta-barrel protein [Gammaproteobacteria bacterium]
MKKVNVSIIAASLLLIGMSAHAITAPTGFYAGVNGGQGFMMAPAVPLTNNWIGDVENYTTTESVWGVNTGYQWAMNPNATYGVELQYTQNGNASYSGSGATGDTGSLTYNSSSVNILGTLSYFWTNGINIFGKAGAAYVMQSADVTGPVYINFVQQSSSTNTVSQVLPMMEFGVGFMPTQHINVYLETNMIYGTMRPSTWGFLGNNGYNSNVYTTTAVKLGINYLF